MVLYPLRFKPIFQQYLWGGRRLGTELNKPIGDGPTYAESWEIVDHGKDQSHVQFGEYAGKSLGEMVQDHGECLLGRETAADIQKETRPTNLRNRFPLLFKFLDACQNLSVQVHPDDRMGRTLIPPDLGKTEAWVVLDTIPGAKIYAGLKSGVDENILRKAIEEAAAEEVLHSFEPGIGDCVFIPAGTVHALGKGLLIGEIQQCSNTTFRLYDWGRVDTDGNSRELHIEAGISATDFLRGPVHPQIPSRLDGIAECLLECKEFSMKRLTLAADLNWTPNEIELSSYSPVNRFRLLVVLSGEISLPDDPAGQPLGKAETVLIPASMENVTVQYSRTTELLLIS